MGSNGVYDSVQEMRSNGSKQHREEPLGTRKQHIKNSKQIKYIWAQRWANQGQEENNKDINEGKARRMTSMVINSGRRQINIGKKEATRRDGSVIVFVRNRNNKLPRRRQQELRKCTEHCWQVGLAAPKYTQVGRGFKGEGGLG